ncbi:hypothetical protein N5079_29140, partial [Planotetraspora sp. A-T 1434]|nr:hypothetical protein [Planotetraspora sp. A-T 1434]
GVRLLDVTGPLEVFGGGERARRRLPAAAGVPGRDRRPHQQRRTARRRHGAAHRGKHLVVFMHRPGGQSQFSVRLRAAGRQGGGFRRLMDEANVDRR